MEEKDIYLTDKKDNSSLHLYGLNAYGKGTKYDFKTKGTDQRAEEIS